MKIATLLPAIAVTAIDCTSAAITLRDQGGITRSVWAVDKVRMVAQQVVVKYVESDGPEWTVPTTGVKAWRVVNEGLQITLTVLNGVTGNIVSNEWTQAVVEATNEAAYRAYAGIAAGFGDNKFMLTIVQQSDCDAYWGTRGVRPERREVEDAPVSRFTKRDELGDLSNAAGDDGMDTCPA